MLKDAPSWTVFIWLNELYIHATFIHTLSAFISTWLCALMSISLSSSQASAADCALCRGKRVESVCLPCGHIPFCNAWYGCPVTLWRRVTHSVHCSSVSVTRGSPCPMCGKQIRQIHRINFQYEIFAFLSPEQVRSLVFQQSSNTPRK